MTEEDQKRKGNKKIVGIIIGAVVLIAVVALIIVLVMKGNRLSDAYFVSDGTKYVATFDGNDTGIFVGEDVAPTKLHIVYYYSGDSVTGMKSYYAFENNDDAKKAYDLICEWDADNADSYELDGKYVIFTADSSQYEGMTAADAKQQIDFVNEIYNNPDENVELIDSTDIETLDGGDNDSETLDDEAGTIDNEEGETVEE